VIRLESRGARTPSHVCLRALRRSVVLAVLLAAACARTSGSIDAVIQTDHASGKPVVRVSGLAEADLPAIESAGWAGPDGRPFVSVRVADAAREAPSLAGRLVVEGRDVVFIPMFGLDAGREYRVDIDPTRLKGVPVPEPLSRIVSLPAIERRPSTVVARVLPSAEVWPENTLRFYVEFSAPMSRTGGLEYVRLLDERGEEVVDPFLPLDVEFWDPDHTRYTFFFDPGRVKRDILPNREMGRALVAGRRYTLEVSADWRDAEGLPLAGPFRRALTVGPMDDRVVDPSTWVVEPPAAGTRDAVVVRFPDALDHGLLGRAVGVSTPDGDVPSGTVTIGEGETSWRFAPDAPWRAGRYQVVVLSILEDPAGNRVGRPFEVDEFSRIDDTPAPERTTLDFVIREGR